MSARAHDRAAAAALTVMRAPAHIVFSRSPLVGALLVAATATVPRAAVSGLAAALVAMGVARALDLDADANRAGDYAYCAFLVGLGVTQTTGVGPVQVGLLVAGAVASVLLTAAMRSWLAPVALPVLSFPFLVAFQLVLGAATMAGVSSVAPASDPSSLAASLPGPVTLFLQGLGALFFLPRADAGALVFVALVVHSRIATSLAVAAFATVVVLGACTPALPGDTSLPWLVENAMLAAMCLGSVFFVPSGSSYLLAVVGALVTVLASLGLTAPFTRLGVSLSILPFNATVILTLSALRQRRRDLAPKSVDFLAGTPEENLAYYRTRRARFDQTHPVAFTLPVRGVWTCTQSIDGAFTHQGDWRHGFDFEVRDEEGAFHRGAGLSNDDYHAFRLPVLAAAAGTVVAVENGIVDNPVGAVDVDRNWGNHVIIQHAAGLCSLVAHLARGSVKVHVGQVLRRGEPLGLVGSSGRSPRPHLHFQLQGSATLGAPTLPCQFTNVVRVEDGARTNRVHTSLVPREDDAVRALAPADEIAAYLGFAPGKRWAFDLDGTVEHLDGELDLLGRAVVRSAEREATLFHGVADGFFTAFDAVGDQSSVVRLLRAALSRVPLEANDTLIWSDLLPARELRPLVGRVLFDVLSPFLARDGIAITFSMHREEALLVVEGISAKRDRRGEPLVVTRAELARDTGIRRVAVTVRGRTSTARRVPEAHLPTPPVRTGVAIPTVPLVARAVAANVID